MIFYFLQSYYFLSKKIIFATYKILKNEKGIL